MTLSSIPKEFLHDLKEKLKEVAVEYGLKVILTLTEHVEALDA